MPELTDYRAALKLGQRAFRQSSSAGSYPYLPALDDFLPEERRTQRVDLGLVQIPMDHIVGTRTTARTAAFAANFMPLMPEDSEFAAKWERLCQAHLDEGIREPIRAYEYLNRYYVEEGNKRVSVLRYFGALTVAGRVTRILPERLTDHPLYEEYLDFYAASRVNYVECAKPGGYARLQELVGKAPGAPWTDDDRQRFEASYYTFKRVYESLGGTELGAAAGDAMVAYMEVYGYASIARSGSSELRKLLAKVWEEVEMQAEPEPVDVKLTPETKGASLIAKMLKPSPRRLRVAFVHDRNPDLSGWTYGHELGRLHVQRVFGPELETTAYFDALDVDPLPLIQGAIDDGNEVVFTTSPRLLPASLKAAVDNPRAIILNCSINSSHRYVRTYYARMYEAKFIAGMIAGSLAAKDDVGYVCDYPIFGQVSGVNAFALGVQMVNPWAKVHLEWSSVGGVHDAERRLVEQGVWIISSQDLAQLKDRDGAPFGLSIITEGGSVNLAQPDWLWGAYYEQLLRQFQDRSLQAQYAESGRAVNYYWGMSAGVIGMRYSDELPPATRKMAGLLEKAIRQGVCRPFWGPLADQAGNEVLGAHQSLSPEQIIRMSWLNENVVGSLPAWEDLDAVAKLTVGIAGVMMG